MPEKWLYLTFILLSPYSLILFLGLFLILGLCLFLLLFLLCQFIPLYATLCDRIPLYTKLYQSIRPHTIIYLSNRLIFVTQVERPSVAFLSGCFYMVSLLIYIISQSLNYEIGAVAMFRFTGFPSLIILYGFASLIYIHYHIFYMVNFL